MTEIALTAPVEEGAPVLQGDVYAFTCLLPGQAVTIGGDVVPSEGRGDSKRPAGLVIQRSGEFTGGTYADNAARERAARSR